MPRWPKRAGFFIAIARRAGLGAGNGRGADAIICQFDAFRCKATDCREEKQNRMQPFVNAGSIGF